ncbi:hypothetical protein C8Q75DRAFT_802970 [Abortiporus biennis]|nr:hypothetical protein C8Q75DRAFT_802970 [Abortiporus biennis]
MTLSSAVNVHPLTTIHAMFSRAFLASFFAVSLVSQTIAAPLIDVEQRDLDSVVQDIVLRSPLFGIGHLFHHYDDKDLAAPAPIPTSHHCKSSKPKQHHTLQSATKKLNFYKPIFATSYSKGKNVVGQHPKDFDVKLTDFSPKGGYYMFDDINDAKWYGNAMKTSNSTTYSVVTLQWDPSKVKSFQLKEFKKPDSEWNKFVLHNYHKNSQRISPDRTKKFYHMIAGPIAAKFEKKTHKFDQAKSEIDCKGIFQYAVVDKEALAGLTVTKVEDFHSKSSWTTNGGKEPAQ